MDDITYTFRPAALGTPWQFTLGRDEISYHVGRKSGRVLLRDVRRVRMSFRPSTTLISRFRTEIWAPGAPKLDLQSMSWKSMIEQERRDAEYKAFIAELHRRLAGRGAAARYELGVYPAIYWVGVGLFAIVALAIAGLIVRGVQMRFWSGTAFVVLFFAGFLWQAGNYFHRNRPGRYDPLALPEELLPKP